ncbi:MAG: ATP-binding protein [Planctomycetota bacterium]|nr:ATP-binding protein [Planctomycetota bacterium]
MFFVGRKKEIGLITRALERGENVIITGKYGSGRTALARNITENEKDRWHFIMTDFSQIPSKACSDIFNQLFSSTSHKKKHSLHYKPMRFKIANIALENTISPVIVLDNIEKLPPRRLDLIRYLASDGHFQFVAITENFLPEADFTRLRAILLPCITVSLGRLGYVSALEFFRHFAPQCGWTESRIKSLSEITHGYPLGMKEAVKQELLLKQRMSR